MHSLAWQDDSRYDCLPKPCRSLILNTHMESHQGCNSRSRGSDALFWPQQYTSTEVNTHEHRLNKSLKVCNCDWFKAIVSSSLTLWHDVTYKYAGCIPSYHETQAACGPQSGPARFKAFDWEQLCLLDVQCDPPWLSCTVAQASVIVLSLRKELCSRKSAAIAERGHVGWVWGRGAVNTQEPEAG